MEILTCWAPYGLNLNIIRVKDHLGIGHTTVASSSASEAEAEFCSTPTIKTSSDYPSIDIPSKNVCFIFKKKKNKRKRKNKLNTRPRKPKSRIS